MLLTATLGAVLGGGLVLGVLFAASALVGSDEGTAPTVEPWIVTAVTRGTGDIIVYRIEYTIPGGGTTAWVRQLPSARGTGLQVGRALNDCWGSAHVGDPLPECARAARIPATATP